MELLTKFRFEVDWGGTKIGFSEVSGLNVETELIEYRDGKTPGDAKLKQAGLKKYGNVTLKRGMFRSDNEFFAWWKETFEDKYKREVTIKLLNESGDPVVSWSLQEAWPVKVDSTDLKADGNEIAIESIELAHEGLKLEVY